jgi:AcrR family transcriptional regulator
VPREVVKRVGERAYRYRVESYRDAVSGKARARWTYLGKVDAVDSAATIPPAPARSPQGTRRRLVEALAALLEQRPYAEVTASAIATEAGAAHGTFYRHFRDKRAALDALFDDVRERIARERPSFTGDLGTLESERARVAAWVSALVRAPADRPGLFRAFHARCAVEPELARARTAARDATVRALASYLARLELAGYCSVESPEALAGAVQATLDGIKLRAVFDRAVFAESDVDGVVALIDRSIFARPVRRG